MELSFKSMDFVIDVRTTKRDPLNVSVLVESKLLYYFSLFVDQSSPD